MLMDHPYFSGFAEIMKLGRRLQLRQLVLATAQIYVRRFYCKVELRRTNPYLVMATAVYLAGKMEECPVHIRVVVNEARNAWPGKRIPPSLIGPGYLVIDVKDARLHHHRRLGDGRVRILAHRGDEITAHRSPPVSDADGPPPTFVTLDG